MDNRGEIVDEKDREWIAVRSQWHPVMRQLGENDYSKNGMAYDIREALITREMGLSEGRNDAKKGD